jgi:valyl-tRNA synthetase
MLKGRCFNSEGAFTEQEQKSAWFALHQALKVILRALAPLTPFITDRIYRDLYLPEGIHAESYPSPREDWKSNLIGQTALLLQTNGGFWKFKRENGLSLRQGLPAAIVSENLRPWAKDLQAMHGILEIGFGKPDRDGYEEVTLPEMEGTIFIMPPNVEE